MNYLIIYLNTEAFTIWLAILWACINTINKVAYARPEPVTNWILNHHALISASAGLTNECLVPL